MPEPGGVTPDRILQMAWGFAPPLAMEAAVKHGLFDALDRGPMTLAEAAEATGASRRGMRMILELLAGLGLLQRGDDQRFSLAPDSAMFLVSTKPAFVGGMIKHCSEQLLPSWMRLNEAVATGKPTRAVNKERVGQEFFQNFVADLFPMNYRAARCLAEYVMQGRDGAPTRVLDLAAGSGVWGIAIAQSAPKVTVTAVDWSGVLPVTQKIAQRFRVKDRFTFVAGDLESAEFGTGYDVATLGHILHSEGEERSRTLLKKTFDALAPGGTIAIAEYLVNADRSGPPGGLIFALNMLVNTERGDTFSFEQIGGWLEEAGFRDVRPLEAPAPAPLILATRP